MNIEETVKKMSLEEKVALGSGKNIWETKDYEKYGIPSLFMSDGPHGLRKQELGTGTDMLGINESVPATCFPSEVTTASSWDTELLEQIGSAVGEEARSLKVGLVLGPGANIKRNPLCGRNFEYFSEDPLLAGELAAGFIRGVESDGTGSCLKHFACNSQEQSRFTSDGCVDERTLREIYLTGFEIAVKKGRPSAIMCAYPKLNGTHCSDNKKLLTDILREDWGYDGMVVTDWGAMNDRIEGFRAGCDLSMPGGNAYMEKEVLKAVRDGKLSEKYIDASAARILKLAFREKETLSNEALKKAKDHHGLAVKAAESGAVLLKNENNMLPVSTNKETLAIVGFMGKKLRIQGAGSSHINPTKEQSPLELFTEASYAQGCLENGDTTDELLSEIKRAAEAADKVIVFAGLPGSYESEGYDRESMTMPEGPLRMIKAAADANSNTAVVLLSGSVVECPWADSVRAILYMGLPGQGGAEAAYNLLTGRANPSGKLAESWPYVYDDVPSSEIYGKTKDALYEEGIYVGYRYYEKAGISTRWPFGYGLSYTSFAFSDLSINGNTVCVTVSNTGSVPGSEVVQLYVGRDGQDGVHRPVRELKAFCKVSLQPGEDKRVSLELPERAFSIWQDGWVTEAGDYFITVGTEKIRIYADGKQLKADSEGWYRNTEGKPSRDSWERVLGRRYEPTKSVKGSYNMDSTVEEMMKQSLVMKIIYKSTEKRLAKQFGADSPDFRMMMSASVEGPFRCMQMFGGMSSGFFEGLLQMANGHYLRGIMKILKK